MTATLSEKAALKQQESGFCWGLIRKLSNRRGRSASINAINSVLNVNTVLDDDPTQTLPVPPPPPYRNSPPSPSLATLVGDADHAPDPNRIARDNDPRSRRPRRLSKPRSGVDSIYSPAANSPTSPSTTSPGSARNSVASFLATASTRSPKPKNNTNLDSSGRPRPPVSGTKTTTSPHARSPSSPNAHDYHYKRARRESANSTSRTREAILCLQAVLDACEAGAVTDLGHVIEQVVLARNILVGEESPTTVDLAKFGVRVDGDGDADMVMHSGGVVGGGSPSIAAAASSTTTLMATLPPPNSRASISMPSLMLAPPPPPRVSVGA